VGSKEKTETNKQTKENGNVPGHMCSHSLTQSDMLDSDIDCRRQAFLWWCRGQWCGGAIV